MKQFSIAPWILLFGASHQLRNREMQISMGQSDTKKISKCQNGPLNVTLEEKALLEFVKTNPKATHLSATGGTPRASRATILQDYTDLFSLLDNNLIHAEHYVGENWWNEEDKEDEEDDEDDEIE